MRRFLILVNSLGFTLSSLWANPEGPVVVHGSATFSSQEKVLEIGNLSERAIIHWENFSIGEGELTRFLQGSSEAAVLNRVVGGQASEILGKLSADGQVYLINERGVLIGKEAVIDTAAFVASTYDVLDREFLAGEELLFEGASKEKIENFGKICTRDGHLLLVAKRVYNYGELEAHGGDALLGAGYEIHFKPRAEEPLAILLDDVSSPAPPLVETHGTVRASKAPLLSAVKQSTPQIQLQEDQGFSCGKNSRPWKGNMFPKWYGGRGRDRCRFCFTDGNDQGGFCRIIGGELCRCREGGDRFSFDWDPGRGDAVFFGAV